MDKNADWKMWRADAEEQGNLTDGTNLYCDKLMKIPKQHNELLAAVKLLPKNDDTRAFHAAVECGINRTARSRLCTVVWSVCGLTSHSRELYYLLPYSWYTTCKACP